MAKTLDKSRPYATIHHADVSDGSAYQQDGETFDALGRVWNPSATPDSGEPAAPSTDDASFRAAVEAEVARRLAQSKPEPEAKPGPKQTVIGKVDRSMQG